MLKQQMRKLWSWFGLGLCTVFLLAACSSQTLVMGTSADYPPYEFKEQSGEIVGFDIDIAQRIATELNFTLEVQDMNFDDLIAALEAGEVDFVMAGMSPTPERLEKADFTDLYHKDESVFLTRLGTDLASVEDLEGKKVAAQVGSTQESALFDRQDLVVIGMDKVGSMIQALKDNEAEAVLVEANVADKYLQSNPDLQIALKFDTGVQGSAIALPKDSPRTAEFNEILNQLKTDGTIKELAQKWFE